MALLLIKNYILDISNNLTTQEQEELKAYKELQQKKKEDLKTNSLKYKQMIIDTAITKLQKENKNINVTNISNATKKHHTTIKKYIKQLSFEF